MRNSILILTALALAMMAGILVTFDAAAQTAVIDEAGITYDKETPKYSDTVTITVPVVFVDAEPVTDGIVLEWKLCTDLSCEIPTKTVMTDNGDGTYSATIGGPFPEMDAFANPYVDIGFTVEVTYTPTGGGDEQMVESAEIELYFDEDTTHTDDDDTHDDDTDDDEDEEEDSPIGFEVLLIGVIIVIGIFSFKRRK